MDNDQRPDTERVRGLSTPGEPHTMRFSLDEDGNRIDGNEYEVKRPTRGDLRTIRKHLAFTLAGDLGTDAGRYLDVLDGEMLEAEAYLLYTLTRAPDRWYEDGPNGKPVLHFDKLDEAEIQAVWRAAHRFFGVATRSSSAT